MQITKVVTGIDSFKGSLTSFETGEAVRIRVFTSFNDAIKRESLK